MTHTVAYAELTRVLPWSIRALGYPFGTADRASHLVATAAALDPMVLDAIAAARHRPASGFSHCCSAGGLRIETEGCSLLEIGPVVMDYVAAHAGEAALLTARISGATDLELLPAVLLIGAGYGLNSVALRPDNGGGWLCMQANSEDPRLWSGTGRDGLLARIGREDFASGIAGAEAGADLVLLTTAGPLDMVGEPTGTPPADAIAAAHARGIPIRPETLEALYALEMITWAPTSERSRAQAGFTPKPAPAP